MEAHSLGNRTDTVIDITVRGAPVGGSNTKNVLDDLLRPTELGDDLFVREGSHGVVTPGVNGNLVLRHVLVLEESGVRDRTRADDEERSLQVDGVEVVKKITGVQSGTVVVGETPGHLVWALFNVVIGLATTAGPPATGGVGSSRSVRRAAAICSGGSEVGDINARSRDLLDPLLNLRRVRGGELRRESGSSRGRA